MSFRRIHAPQDLGVAIRDARSERGLTQAEVAANAGVSREWLNGVEQGKRPRAELTKTLAVLASLHITLSTQSESSATSEPPLSNRPTTGDITNRAIAAARRDALNPGSA